MFQKKVNNYTLLFFFLIVFGSVITLTSLSSSYSYLVEIKTTLNNTIINVYSSIRDRLPFINKREINSNTSKNDIPIIEKCSSKPMNNNLTNSTDETLKKLAQLQTICNSSVVSSSFIFIEMPNSEISASRIATDLSKRLKAFRNAGITPIVIIEPITAWGLVDFEEFNDGFYNNWIGSFFSRLKNEGIKEEQLGIWVPFPEANLPYWNRGNSSPSLFGQNINMYSSLIRKHYPNVRISILLNSVSYASDDNNWENGKYTTLLPYIKDIKPGSIYSFGLQGFPWKSAKNINNKITIYDPLEFVNPNLAIQAAEYLKIKKIWINTGTFRAKYTNDSTRMITEASKQREEILNELFSVLQILKAKNFDVAINIFAENKSETQEATDWSYWGDNSSSTDAHTDILKLFIQKVVNEKIDFWIFDK